MDTKLKLVVVGTGRCGTGYISKVLTRLDIFCGHETIFGVNGMRMRGPCVADASWLAVPYLPLLDDAVMLVHQIRNPLSTIRSLSEMRGLLRAPLNEYGEYILKYLPLCFDIEDLIERAAFFWLEWTRMIENHVNLWWNVENIPSNVLSVVMNHCGVGLVDPESRIEGVLSAIPTDVNSRITKRSREITVGDCGRFADDVVTFCRRYGYAV